ncbi:MAG: hypothetical protein LBL26_05280 [Peptococcaceae bacterium]|jgi:hypothetical protein|nr:hypothetical protein [Peptococcaceae bacterium]
MITLHSDRLRVELPEPGERPNDRTRFERAAYISEVVLDGAIQFAANEPKNLAHPPTGGRGLCCECRTDYSASAEIGGYFPKFGVGLIRKTDDQPFIFHRRYDNVQMFPIRYDHSEDTATFVTEPISCMGYALRTQKTVRVRGNVLTVDAAAENLGEKDIEFIEFCHNFLSVDGMALGPAYRIAFPTLRDFGQRRMTDINGALCSLRQDGKGFTYCEFSAGVSHISVDLSGMTQAPFTWRMSNDIAKAYVEAAESFHPAWLEIWSIDHIISPEAFQRRLLEPGKAHNWKRTWRFEAYNSEAN